LKTRWLFETGK